MPMSIISGDAPASRSARIVRIILRETWVRWVMLGLVALCLLAIPIFLLSMRTEQMDTRLVSRQLPAVLQRLERSIGYAGFIHDFKNAVLRPDEPRYYDSAVKDYDRAVAALDELQKLGLEIGQQFDFAALRGTLANYRTNLDQVRALGALGLPPERIDEEVRIPDAAAAHDLDMIHKQVLDELDAYLAASSRRLWIIGASISTLLAMLAVGGLMFVGTNYVIERDRQREAKAIHERLASLGRLTSGIAHDVNNMLATIHYAVELATDDPGISDSSRKFLQSADRAVKSGQDLTGRLLSFARPQPGSPVPIPAAEVLAAAEELALPQLNNGVTLLLRTIPAELAVHCDRSQLENALMNLILNASDAIAQSGRGSQITLSANREEDLQLGPEAPRPVGALDGFVGLTVSDNGPGMTEEVLSHAMDPFFTTKASQKGSGLGLSIVYGFCRSSGGAMRISSVEGRGTKISLILPRGAV